MGRAGLFPSNDVWHEQSVGHRARLETHEDLARQDRRAKTPGQRRPGLERQQGLGVLYAFATRSISLSNRTDGIWVSKARIVLLSGSNGRYSTPQPSAPRCTGCFVTTCIRMRSPRTFPRTGRSSPSCSQTKRPPWLKRFAHSAFASANKPRSSAWSLPRGRYSQRPGRRAYRFVNRLVYSTTAIISISTIASG